MTPLPEGWPRITPALFYDDAPAMIEWLCRAFGFAVRIRVDGAEGQIIHSELTFGEGLVMVSSPRPPAAYGVALGPARAGPQNQSLFIYVDDADSHCAHAQSCGARVVAPLADHDYGPEHWTDRGYAALDPEGQLWWFATRLRTGTGASAQAAR